MYILSLDTHFEDLKDNLSTTFPLSTDNMYIGALSKFLFQVEFSFWLEVPWYEYEFQVLKLIYIYIYIYMYTLYVYIHEQVNLSNSTQIVKLVY